MYVGFQTQIDSLRGRVQSGKYVGFQTQIDSLRGRVQSGKEPIGVHHVGRALALIVPLLPR